MGLVDGSGSAVLCEDQRFRNQPSSYEAYGSGFLVAPDAIATAKHVLETAFHYDSIDKLRFVFGWSMVDAHAAKRIPATDIYAAQAVMAQGEGDAVAQDWALVRLTTSVQGIEPLPLADAEPVVGTPLFCFGYPTQLPLKYSTGWISDISDPGLFRGPVTAFAESSGGPVFNKDTGEVQGIYVHGPADYALRFNCVIACDYPADDVSDHGKMVRIQRLGLGAGA
ncbi:trypsin-like serine peptidase [Myxococcus sp. 1LA]